MSEEKNPVQSVCGADESEIRSSLITLNSDSNIVKLAPARSMHAVRESVEWDAAWSLLHLADFAPSETIALPKQTSIGDQLSASSKESHSNVNQFSDKSLLTMARKIPMAFQSAVSHQMTKSENTAQTARKNLPLVSPQTIAGVSHSSAGKSLSQVIQPSLASSMVTQREIASPSSARASASNEPRIRTVEKKEVKFNAVSVYYFNRIQGFTSVPSQGGCSLGMESKHTHMEILPVENYGKEKINSQRNRPSPSLVLLSDGNEDSTEESNDLPVCEVTCKKLKPLSVNKRHALLRASGVQKIDASEEKECDALRSSRQYCGCECKTTCEPNICSCSILGIKCLVELFAFPCGCSHDSCGNPNGRYEYNLNTVQNHLKKYINNIEKKI